MLPNRRGICRHPKYELQLSHIAEKYPRAPEVVTGAEWSLARSPEVDGIMVQQIGVWQARVSAGTDLPPVLLYYTFNPRILQMLTIVYADSN